MKNVIIAGVSRSGKSILSKRLSNEFLFSHIPVDAVVSTLAKAFPQCGITHYGLLFEEMCLNLRQFLFELTRQLDFEDIRYILDCYHLLPVSVVENPAWKHHEIVFLGYPMADPKQKLKDIRFHAKAPDWTLEISDRDMMQNISKFINESRYLQSECDRLGLRFVDTSKNFELTTDQLFNELKIILEAC